jgi:hypothetical protein
MSEEAVERGEGGVGEEAKGKGYPKAVPFILTNVFFERFASGGVFGNQTVIKILTKH